MRFIGIFLLVSAYASAAAGYDSSWYFMDEFLPGEYPLGVVVKVENAKVMGRTDSDPALERTVECALPKNAVFSPWNAARRETIKYRTWEQILNYTVKEDFSYKFDGDEHPATDVKKGETVGVLLYIGEGNARVRVQDKEYVVSLFDILPHLEGFDPHEFNLNAKVDQWMKLPCTNGGQAWVLFSDLDPASGVEASMEGVTDYGTAVDLDQVPPPQQ